MNNSTAARGTKSADTRAATYGGSQAPNVKLEDLENELDRKIREKELVQSRLRVQPPMKLRDASVKPAKIEPSAFTQSEIPILCGR